MRRQGLNAPYLSFRTKLTKDAKNFRLLLHPCFCIDAVISRFNLKNYGKEDEKFTRRNDT